MSSLLLLLSSRRFLASVVNKTLPKRLLNADAAPMEKLRSRLLWQSKKRGILENDILIGGFAEENLAKMSAEELASYDEMINGRHMEWDLYYYFTGRREAPEDLCDNPTFQQIRKYVLARKHGGEQR